jgi:CheY-like chemotaxis protein
MSKRILFLDDDKGRHSYFRSLANSIGIIPECVETVEECCAKIKTSYFDIISLDHDLSGEIYIDQSRKDCGMEVVRFLESNEIQQGEVICHSYNTKARYEMYKRLSILSTIKRSHNEPFAMPEYDQLIKQLSNL